MAFRKKDNISSSADRELAVDERKFIGKNAVLAKTSRQGKTEFEFIGLGTLDFFGKSSFLNSAQFEQLDNGRVIAKSMVVEQEVDGEFMVTVIRSENDKAVESQFSGYAVPVSGGSQASTCIGFKGHLETEK